jgi:hypothetical protein
MQFLTSVLVTMHFKVAVALRAGSVELGYTFGLICGCARHRVCGCGKQAGYFLLDRRWFACRWRVPFGGSTL